MACAAAEECHSRGRKVAVFTWAAKQEVDMRHNIPFVTADTSDGAFELDNDVADAAGNLMQHGLVLVDEVCTLQKDVFDRNMDVWTLASRLPTLVFMGNWHQLEPYDGSHVPCESISQSECYPYLSVHILRKQHRSTDDRLLNFQNVVRAPTILQVKNGGV